MLTVWEEDHQLEYSESHLGNVHVEPTIERYQYCMGLKRAFESLISEQYRSYILTVGCIVASISYCTDDGHFKGFDSHARDFYGKSHSWGMWSIRYIIYRQLSASLSKFIYIISSVMHVFWLILTYDLLEDRCINDVIIKNFF